MLLWPRNLPNSKRVVEHLHFFMHRTFLRLCTSPKRQTRQSIQGIVKAATTITTTDAMTTSTSATTTTTASKKDLWIVRHGQATHNPRAEAAKAAGCSHDEFMQLMMQDDSLDSDLTALGVQQGQAAHTQYRHVWSNNNNGSDFFDLVVASPLSRALHTADLVAPPFQTFTTTAKRICHEQFREINGKLLNAKRQTRQALATKFPHWDFSLLPTDDDTQWTETLETHAACKARGFDGLCWLLKDRPQDDRVLLVAHGGILRFCMAEYPDRIVMRDERRKRRTTTTATTSTTTTNNSNDLQGHRPVTARFENCEVRRYRLEWENETLQDQGRIVLTEVDVC